jgi:hypothetical protein
MRLLKPHSSRHHAKNTEFNGAPPSKRAVLLAFGQLSQPRMNVGCGFRLSSVSRTVKLPHGLHRALNLRPVPPMLLRSRNLAQPSKLGNDLDGTRVSVLNRIRNSQFYNAQHDRFSMQRNVQVMLPLSLRVQPTFGQARLHSNGLHRDRVRCLLWHRNVANTFRRQRQLCANGKVIRGNFRRWRSRLTHRSNTEVPTRENVIDSHDREYRGKSCLGPNFP